MMLPLDAPEWQEADYMFKADHLLTMQVDVPADFARLAANPDDFEPLWDLFESVCHQDTLCRATFLAMPYFVEALRVARTAARKQELLGFIGTVEEATRPEWEDWPIGESYKQAIADAYTLAMMMTSDTTLPFEVRKRAFLFPAQIRGYQGLRDFLAAEDDRRNLSCPDCEFGYLLREEGGDYFSQSYQHPPVRTPIRRKERVEPGWPTASDEELAWCQLACGPGLETLLGWAQVYYGWIECGNCHRELRICTERERERAQGKGCPCDRCRSKRDAWRERQRSADAVEGWG